jgi:hypothetical protein
MLSEGNVVPTNDQLANWDESLGESLAFWFLQELQRREAAHDDVAWDKVRENHAFLTDSLAVTLVVGSLKRDLRRIEEVVGEQISPEVVEISDSLRSWEVLQRR